MNWTYVQTEKLGFSFLFYERTKLFLEKVNSHYWSWANITLMPKCFLSHSTIIYMYSENLFSTARAPLISSKTTSA